MPNFGPSFWSEVEAAGLNGLPFKIHGDEIDLSDPRLTQAQKDAINAVVAAHDSAAPAPPEPLTDTEAMVKDLLTFADGTRPQPDRDAAKSRLEARLQGR